jgi:hypothetical protein
MLASPYAASVCTFFIPNKGAIREVGRVNASIDRPNDNYRKGRQEQLRVPAYHVTSVTPHFRLGGWVCPIAQTLSLRRCILHYGGTRDG